MITEQDWQDAKEEFGDEAFKRFFITWYDEDVGVGTKYQFSDNDHVAMCPEFEEIEFKPLPELFAHDVDVYRDDAYLMWECAGIGWVNCSSNDDILNPDFYCRRKKSAALPFDIERAKSGDVVEIFANNYWKKCHSKTFENRKYPLIQIDNISVSEHFLRMKYPPKAKK